MSKHVLNPDEAFSLIKESCLFAADRDKVPAMEAYMKNKFTFYGIPAPQRKLISKSIKHAYIITNTGDLWSLIDLLWFDSHRECQYIAIDLLTSIVRKLALEDVDRLKRLILEKSWWDTVDALAVNLVGPVLLHYPEDLKEKSIVS
jgi:3-methyladenine DNA glycosylase AlkD